MRLLTKIRCFFQAALIRLKESDYDYVRFDVGTNSAMLVVVFVVVTYIAIQSDVLAWRYLRGIEPGLAFFIGFFTVVFGVSFYKYWRLDDRSVYTLHLAKSDLLPKDLNVIGSFKDFSFAVGRHVKFPYGELTSVTRKAVSITIFLNLALITLDNAGYTSLAETPASLIEPGTNFCPVEEDIEPPPPIEGCELIIRAYELGYAEDLGVCAPEEIDPETLKICEKRRIDEPYLHYMSRVVVSSVTNWVGYLNPTTVDRVRSKFQRQLQDLEALRDYQRYAMASSPRASHHIWTNLPYPANDLVRQYRELFQPSHCIAQFQNQTNTVDVAENDPRKDSKLLEHAYGQLLFNPKGELSVAYCKEFTIHWESTPDSCTRLAADPEAQLREDEAWEEVSLVLRRHDVASAIIELENDLRELEQEEEAAEDEAAGDNDSVPADEELAMDDAGNPIEEETAELGTVLRPKNEVVSFQCFMQEESAESWVSDHQFNLDNTAFTATTRYFPKLSGAGEAQIGMYDELARLLEEDFFYSPLTSRSAMDLQGRGSQRNANSLNQPSYLLSRLEMLRNVDIFLGNNWVLEREDLLGVYPYHVHLQNYVNSFRETYQQSRGRL